MHIEKLEEDLKKLIMKQENTSTEYEVIHYLSEAIYYLTATDAMNRVEGESSSYSMGIHHRHPIYDYSMDGRRGMDGDGDGRYSERSMSSYMQPHEAYVREVAGYPGRY